MRLRGREVVVEEWAPPLTVAAHDRRSLSPVAVVARRCRSRSQLWIHTLLTMIG
jgi:hypothetical protein